MTVVRKKGSKPADYEVMMDDGRAADAFPLDLILAIINRINWAISTFEWDKWEVDGRLCGKASEAALACCAIDMGLVNIGSRSPEAQQVVVDQAIELLMSMAIIRCRGTKRIDP